MNTLAKTTEYENLSLTQLKALVEKVQAKDPAATEELAHRFEGLVVKTANLEIIKENFQEDALNETWVTFFDIVHSYNCRSFGHFAGYVRKTLYNRLLNKIFRDKSVDYPIHLEALQEDNEQLDFVDEHDAIEELISEETVRAALAKLTAKERDLVVKTVLEGVSMKEYECLTATAHSVINRRRSNALKKLRSLLGL